MVLVRHALARATISDFCCKNHCTVGAVSCKGRLENGSIDRSVTMNWRIYLPTPVY